MARFSGHKSSNEIYKLPVFVEKWTDYSSKYGIGFKMSDTTIGVYFNDRTILYENAVFCPDLLLF